MSITTTDKKELIFMAAKVERLISKGFHVEHHKIILDKILARIDDLESEYADDVVIVTGIETVDAEEQKIDKEVSKCGGTWVKRRNLRKKLISEHNDKIKMQIDSIKKVIRSMISCREQDKRGLFAKITELELKIIR